jgi:hypothetical protein
MIVEEMLAVQNGGYLKRLDVVLPDHPYYSA